MEHDSSICVSTALYVPLAEVSLNPIRAQGAGGQNVNKVSTAIHLRFDIATSTAFNDDQRQRLLTHSDKRISKEGLVVIKAQRFRSQEKNRADALERLVALLQKGLFEARPRKKTRTPRKSKQKRLDDKTQRGRLKKNRSKDFE
jgi:ribosome-associated protein